MLENGKISDHQTMLLLIATVLPTSIFSLPAFTAAEAKEDAWLSVIIASFIGVAVILNIVALGRKFPGKTILEYSEDIVGKIPGKFVGLILIGFFLYLTALTTREFTEFMLSVFLEDMPMLVLVVSILFVSALAVLQGLEVISRLNVILITIVVGFFLLSLVMAAEEFQPIRILPFFANGILPIIKGSFPVAGRIGEVFVLAFLLPYMNQTLSARRTGLSAVLILTSLFSLTVLVAILCFGALQTGRLLFPNYMVARNIIITDIIERVESVFMLIWVVGAFTKITICYYITVLATGQWLKLSRYQSLVLPIGTLIVALVLIIHVNISELVGFLRKIWSPYALSIELGIPFILLTIAFIGRKGVKMS